MAKLALINRQLKREAMVKQFAGKRRALETIINDQSLSEEDRFQARLKLQALPRNSSPTRLRNRCEITGRPRGTYSKFALGRNKLREIVMRGEVPGVTKASW
ncbi:MAG: 30S ribosomal protein S14 [Burkholderiales bacterium]